MEPEVPEVPGVGGTVFLLFLRLLSHRLLAQQTLVAVVVAAEGSGLPV